MRLTLVLQFSCLYFDTTLRGPLHQVESAVKQLLLVGIYRVGLESHIANKSYVGQGTVSVVCWHDFGLL